MPNPLFRKLENYVRLPAADRQALEEAMRHTTHVEAREDIVRHGDEPRVLNVILEGWACRYKNLRDGRRQIIAFLLPGDFCDPFNHLLGAVDHYIGTLSPVTLAAIPRATARLLVARSPELAEAFLWDMILAGEIQREWTLSLGRRTATERLAHLFCEFAVRLRLAGLNFGGSFDLPITQAEMGDAMGLSSVHVNRTLQDLRRAGFIALKGRHMEILDEAGLRELAMFEPLYLHLRRDAESGGVSQGM